METDVYRVVLFVRGGCLTSIVFPLSGFPPMSMGDHYVFIHVPPLNPSP